MVLPEVWYESVELECGWTCVLVAGVDPETTVD